jgi:hypothetical protein
MGPVFPRFILRKAIFGSKRCRLVDTCTTTV